MVRYDADVTTFPVDRRRFHRATSSTVAHIAPAEYGCVMLKYGARCQPVESWSYPAARPGSTRLVTVVAVGQAERTQELRFEVAGKGLSRHTVEQHPDENVA